MFVSRKLSNLFSRLTIASYRQFSPLQSSLFSVRKMSTEQHGKKRQNSFKTDWKQRKKFKADTKNEDGTIMTSEESYEAGLNPVGPPKNDKPLTAEAGLDAVTPYRNLPYLKQIRKKRSDVVKSLKRIKREIADGVKRINRNNAVLVKNGDTSISSEPYTYDLPYSSNNTVCPLAHVVGSPTMTGYRNKNEFTCGTGIDNLPTTGFQCGRYMDGESRIGSPANCLSAPECALEVAELFTKFMREHPIGSKYTTWNKTNRDGVYRLITVRNSTALGMMMVNVQLNNLNIADPEEYEVLKKAITDYLVENLYGGDLYIANTAEHNYVIPDLKPTEIEPTELGKAFAERTKHSLTSLLIQEYDGVSNAAPDTCNVITLFGHSSIYDVISGLTFRVNLNSFFQVNVKGAEILYAKAAQWALCAPHDFNMPEEAILETYAPMDPEYAEKTRILLEEFREYKKTKGLEELKENNEEAAGEEAVEETTVEAAKETKEEIPVSEIDFNPRRQHNYPVTPVSDTPDPEHVKKTLLLDICCGTGTIGLIMSKMVRKTIGLELVPAAIEDAKVNAELNKITNSSFVCGKAEDTIGKVIYENKDDMDFSVGIVDPPRGGLHNDVITALRSSKLKRIVYVSCNASTLADNVVRLAGPTTKKYPGSPFVPIASIAVDMFPHTPHCEAVMLLERRP